MLVTEIAGCSQRNDPDACAHFSALRALCSRLALAGLDDSRFPGFRAKTSQLPRSDSHPKRAYDKVAPRDRARAARRPQKESTHDDYHDLDRRLAGLPDGGDLRTGA